LTGETAGYSKYAALKAAAAAAGKKPGIPLPSKRGSSLNPNRIKTSSGVDFAEGTKAGADSGRVETPTGTAGDSTAFSKRSNATI